MSATRTLLIGLAACVPRLVLAWFAQPALDLLQIGATLLFVGGLLVIAIAVFQFRAVREETVWPVGLVGVVAVAVAAVVVQLAPPGGARIAYDGRAIAPLGAVLYQYLYLLLGAMSQLGLMLVVGSVGLAITHRRSRR